MEPGLLPQHRSQGNTTRGEGGQLLTTCCRSRQVRHVVEKGLQETCTEALLTWGALPAAVLTPKQKSVKTTATGTRPDSIQAPFLSSRWFLT